MNGAVETRDFAPILAEVKPEAERLISLYPQKRSALLPILHAFQDVEGWVSPEAMAAAAEMLELPISAVESTASFYSLFYRKPVGKYMLQPCRNLSCILNGAYETMAHFRKELGIGHLETTDDGLFSYEEVECLAACDRAPCMQVNLEFVYDLTNEKIDAMLAAIRAGTYDVPPLAQTTKPGRTWHPGYDPKKSAGAQNVPSPNDPGGVGDQTGISMIERITRDPMPIKARPTHERLITDGEALLKADGHALLEAGGEPTMEPGDEALVAADSEALLEAGDATPSGVNANTNGDGSAGANAHRAGSGD